MAYRDGIDKCLGPLRPVVNRGAKAVPFLYHSISSTIPLFSLTKNAVLIKIFF
jgi:hypothetical protein